MGSAHAVLAASAELCCWRGQCCCGFAQVLGLLPELLELRERWDSTLTHRVWMMLCGATGWTQWSLLDLFQFGIFYNSLIGDWCIFVCHFTKNSPTTTFVNIYT